MPNFLMQTYSDFRILIVVMCIDLKIYNFVINSWARSAGSEKITHLVWQCKHMINEYRLMDNFYLPK